MRTHKPNRIRSSLAGMVGCLLACLATSIAAEEQLDLTLQKDAKTPQFEFSEERLGGFEQRRASKEVRMRGWQVGKGIYFGQAKVAKKWGVGFVYESGDTVYGVNNRGIQMMKRF